MIRNDVSCECGQGRLCSHSVRIELTTVVTVCEIDIIPIYTHTKRIKQVFWLYIVYQMSYHQRFTFTTFASITNISTDTVAAISQSISLPKKQLSFCFQKLQSKRTAYPLKLLPHQSTRKYVRKKTKAAGPFICQVSENSAKKLKADNFGLKGRRGQKNEKVGSADNRLMMVNRLIGEYNSSDVSIGDFTSICFIKRKIEFFALFQY